MITRIFHESALGRGAIAAVFSMILSGQVIAQELEPEAVPEAAQAAETEVVPDAAQAAEPEADSGQTDMAVQQAEPAATPEKPEEPKKKWNVGKYVQFHGLLQTVIVYRNDYDFDSTPRYYDVEGQTVGMLGTFFKPQISVTPDKHLRIFWEMELGLNLWSRHNPDQYTSGNFDTFRLAHRELYVEGKFFEKKLNFKVGYQFFEDPTRLFLGHWLGAASIGSDLKKAKVTATVGQLPGQTYEGIGLDANNFKHDTFVYGAAAEVPCKQWKFVISLMGMHDAETIGQTLDLLTASARISADYKWINFGLDLALQYGKTDNGAAFADETTLAWALQAFAQVKKDGFDFQLNHLMLSADDRYDRNGSNGAFFYSGKSRSRTIILSEDEIRDQGYNIDEFMGQRRNTFNLLRSGFSLTDFALAYNYKDVFVPAIIVGAGFSLQPENALGGRLVGVEADLDLEIRYKDLLSFHVIGGLLVPGRAGAAFLNRGDMTSTNIQYMVESSLAVMF